MSPARPGGMTGEIQTFDVSERENLNLMQCIAGLLWLLGSIAGQPGVPRTPTWASSRCLNSARWWMWPPLPPRVRATPTTSCPGLWSSTGPTAETSVTTRRWTAVQSCLMPTTTASMRLEPLLTSWSLQSTSTPTGGLTRSPWGWKVNAEKRTQKTSYLQPGDQRSLLDYNVFHEVIIVRDKRDLVLSMLFSCSDLYIGSLPYLQSGLVIYENFTGCMENLYLNHSNNVFAANADQTGWEALTKQNCIDTTPPAAWAASTRGHRWSCLSLLRLRTPRWGWSGTRGPIASTSPSSSGPTRRPGWWCFTGSAPRHSQIFLADSTMNPE